MVVGFTPTNGRLYPHGGRIYPNGVGVTGNFCWPVKKQDINRLKTLMKKEREGINILVHKDRNILVYLDYAQLR